MDSIPAPVIQRWLLEAYPRMGCQLDHTQTWRCPSVGGCLGGDYLQATYEAPRTPARD